MMKQRNPLAPSRATDSSSFTPLRDPSVELQPTGTGNAEAQESLSQQGGASQETPLLVAAYQEMMKVAAGQGAGQRVITVNEFFNRVIKYKSDEANWGTKDYWASPLETLVRQAGDCEDYAIAKYETLRKLGTPASKLRILYTKVLRTQEAHMVAAYITDKGDFFILDNYVKNVRPLEKRVDLASATYSFNEDQLYMGLDREAGKPTLSKWDAMRAREAAGPDPMKLGAAPEEQLTEDMQVAIGLDPGLEELMLNHPALADATKDFLA
ncbi:MAG: transglutaminase-like cysteine peptidase [Deltaproteobacteria bacterium]|nr:transglutaminase-like cysteine peptidase [Deltaproteobacteria bacterium]